MWSWRWRFPIINFWTLNHLLNIIQLKIICWTSQGGEAYERGKGRISSVSMLTSLVIEDHRPSEETQHRQTRGRRSYTLFIADETYVKMWMNMTLNIFQQIVCCFWGGLPSCKSQRLDISYRSRGWASSYSVRALTVFYSFSLFAGLLMTAAVCYFHEAAHCDAIYLKYIWTTLSHCFPAPGYLWPRLFVTFAKPSPVCKFNWSLNGCLDQRPALRAH